MKMRVLPAVCFSLMLVVIRTADLRAQERDYSQPEGASAQTRAINEADSRAEQEAERLVSLAPEKIILLLEQEPGLFLAKPTTLSNDLHEALGMYGVR